MNRKKNNFTSGFTLVETMLFLGISGLLLVSMLAGTTVTIQRQRYSDSVNSTQSFFQKQYNETLNVINARSGRELCNAANIIVPAEGGPAESPGTSDCLVLGRVIEIVPGSDKLDSFAVVGREPSADTTALRDDELFQQYNPTLVRASEVQSFTIPWGAKVLVARKSEGGQINRLVILRSPRSGALYTYGYQTAGGGVSLQDGVLSTNRRATVNVCVRSEDIASSVSVVSIAMGGGPEAVQSKFDVGSSLC